MNKGLISREEVIQTLLPELNKHGDMYFAGKVIRLIDGLPTAFDKEKVIEELQRHSHNYYPSIDHYCLSKKAVNLQDAFEIVQKGGIK